VQKKFRRQGIRFYRLFPKGLKQLCREAGLPVPSSRLKSVSKALKARAEAGAQSVSAHLSRLETLLDWVLREVFRLYANFLCLKWATKDDESMSSFVECVDSDAFNLMQDIAEAYPEYARQLMKDNPFLDYVSATYLDWSLDDEWLARNYPAKLKRRRRWAELLHEHCPESEYLP
jgi:hypothetical protein